MFNTQRRSGYGVSNETAALVSYNPASHELDTAPLPAGLTQDGIPIGGISVIVPGLQTTYYIGSEGSIADIAMPVELYAYNHSDNSVVRNALPANRWATVSYVQAGKKALLVMLGGVDAVRFMPVGWIPRHRWRAYLLTCGAMQLPMNRVYVYDIAANKGYLQPATGTVPSPRVWICAVVASAADNSSHQVWSRSPRIHPANVLTRSMYTAATGPTTTRQRP